MKMGTNSPRASFSRKKALKTNKNPRSVWSSFQEASIRVVTVTICKTWARTERDQGLAGKMKEKVLPRSSSQKSHLGKTSMLHLLVLGLRAPGETRGIWKRVTMARRACC